MVEGDGWSTAASIQDDEDRQPDLPITIHPPVSVCAQIPRQPYLWSVADEKVSGYGSVSNLNWEYPHVDRCLYPDDTPISDIEKALADLTVNKIEVNHFIPIMEMDGTDWLVIMVWSIQVQYEVGMTTIRQYWIDALDPNQITANPTLTGGELDRQPWQIGLVVRKKKLGDQTDPPVFQPIPGQIEHQ
jgi:hypothetical protein